MNQGKNYAERRTKCHCYDDQEENKMLLLKCYCYKTYLEQSI